MMNQDEWDELYISLYESYCYAEIRNEDVREKIGELLDYMGEHNPRQHQQKKTSL